MNRKAPAVGLPLPKTNEMERAAILAQLDRITAAPEFARSDRALRFLRLIVERTLDGRSDLLKESLLAIDAFGRPADFDPKADPVVRVEAIKLRRRLDEYYGRLPQEPVRISIPKGRYLAEFQHAVERKPPRRIVVLPFEDRQCPPAKEWFAPGMTDELIAALARVPGLLVVCRKSNTESSAYNLRLAGSLRWDDERVRVSVRVTSPDGSLLWSGQFDGASDASISVQESIAAAVASRLGLDIPQMPAVRREPLRAAREMVLRGGFELRTTSPGSLERARQCYRRAMVLDPEYAQPYAQMVRLALGEAIHGGGLPAARLSEAEDFMARALALDPESAETHLARGTLLARFLYQWEDAEESFRCALALDPSCAEAYHSLAHECYLPLGRFDEALAANERAVELEPDSQVMRVGIPWIRLVSGDIKEGRAAIEEMRAADPTFFFAQFGAAVAALWDDDPATAIPLLEPFAAVSPVAHTWLVVAYLKAGRTELAAAVRQQALERMQSPMAAALYAAAFGEFETAIEHLEQAVEEHDPNVFSLAVGPEFDVLREYPAYRLLLKRLSLPVLPPIRERVTSARLVSV